jgi:DNA adenine methylase Dam
MQQIDLFTQEYKTQDEKPSKLRKLYSYMGSKRVHLDAINNTMGEILKGKDTMAMEYVEPFLGSGIVFLNLCNSFKSYILNDRQKDLIYFFESYNNINYDRILYWLNKDKENYNIETSKEGYYLFRDSVYNNNSAMNTVDKFITLFMLGNTCINNMLRWGPNGFNQSFGNRKYSNKIDMVLDSLNYCKDKNIKVYSMDFKELFNNMGVDDNSFLFLDPPYANADMSCAWDLSDTTWLCNWLATHNNHFIYFDAYENNESVQDLIKSDLSIKYKVLNKIRNVSPNNKTGERNFVSEIMVYR